MWPFGKKELPESAPAGVPGNETPIHSSATARAEPPSPVTAPPPSSPPFPGQRFSTRQIVADLQGMGLVAQGPFPIREEGGAQRLICKNCGIGYDGFTWEYAMSFVVENLHAAEPKYAIVHVECRKCAAKSAFSPKDILTGRSVDSFGGWNAEDAADALPALAALTENFKERDAKAWLERFCEVLNLEPSTIRE